MSQVSYGTITITDTTDLTTYIRYAKQAPLTAASQFQETPTTETHYIAVLSIPSSDTIPAWNSTDWKWSEFIGTDGVSVLGTREIYYLKTNSTTVTAPANGSDISQTGANVENQWTKSVPTYVTNGEYWTCIQTHLDGSPTWVYGSPVLNQSLTDMNHDIDVIKSVTQQSAEDSQGALSIAHATRQNFWWWGEDQVVSSSFTLPAGAYVSDTKVDTFKANPTGGYLISRSDGVFLNNGQYVLMGLTASALKFYRPGTTKLLSGTETIDAQLDSNGLTLSKGGIKVIPSGGAIGDNNSVYISSDNLGSKVASLVNDNNKTNWRAVIGSKFGVDSEGNLYANNAHINGAITATSLTLGSGVQIPASTGISGLSTVATSGSYNDLDNKPTIPSLTGYIYVDGTVGTTPADGATGFVVSSSGLLTASNAVIYGSIYASKGYIGGWQIGTDGNKTLHNGNANTSPIPGSGVIILSKGIAGPTTATGVLPANQTWAITASNQFGVTTAGKLYATGADISGKITVGSGSDLSAGLTNYSTTSQMNTAIGNATNDMATNAKTDWLVEVTTTGIPDFVTPSVTLKAIVYHRGVLTTSGFTRAWYKNGTGNSLGGEETVTVSDMDAYYVCIISETN